MPKINLKKKVHLNKIFLKYILVLIPGVFLTYILISFSFFLPLIFLRASMESAGVDPMIFLVIIASLILWVSLLLLVIYNKKLGFSKILKICYVPLVILISLLIFAVKF